MLSSARFALAVRSRARLDDEDMAGAAVLLEFKPREQKARPAHSL